MFSKLAIASVIGAVSGQTLSMPILVGSCPNANVALLSTALTLVATVGDTVQLCCNQHFDEAVTLSLAGLTIEASDEECRFPPTIVATDPWVVNAADVTVRGLRFQISGDSMIVVNPSATGFAASSNEFLASDNLEALVDVQADDAVLTDNVARVTTGVGAGKPVFGFTDSSDSQVRHNEFFHVRAASDVSAVVHVTGQNNMIISNNVIETRGAGILVDGTDCVTIEENTIIGSVLAISVVAVDVVEVRKNVVLGPVQGIVLTDSSWLIVNENTVELPKSSMQEAIVIDAKTIDFMSAIVEDNLVLAGSINVHGQSGKAVVSENTIMAAAVPSISVADLHGAAIDGNTISYGSAAAILIANTFEASLTNNKLANNAIGLSVNPAPATIAASKLDAISNTFSANAISASFSDITTLKFSQNTVQGSTQVGVLVAASVDAGSIASNSFLFNKAFVVSSSLKTSFLNNIVKYRSGCPSSDYSLPAAISVSNSLSQCTTVDP